MISPSDSDSFSGSDSETTISGSEKSGDETIHQSDIDFIDDCDISSDESSDELSDYIDNFSYQV